MQHEHNRSRPKIDMKDIEVIRLGRLDYASARRRMDETHAAVVDGRSTGEILFCEHDPVYTAGRRTEPGTAPAGAVEIERGGRVTFHGPGQLVIYPIVRLPERDLNAWLRRLEAFGCAICGSFGLAAEPSVDGTGVFVGGSKVASIGVAVRRWVNLHGIAINGSMDLRAFHTIRPCGLDPNQLSDLRTVLGRDLPISELDSAAERALPHLLGPRDTDA